MTPIKIPDGDKLWRIRVAINAYDDCECDLPQCMQMIKWALETDEYTEQDIIDAQREVTELTKP